MIPPAPALLARSGEVLGVVGVVADTLSEAESRRRIFLIAGALALLGIILLVATIWWWRSTRDEHPALGPLEVMSARAWRRAGTAERIRLLDRARPRHAGASLPVVPPEPVDLSVLASGDHAGFDDLREIDELLGLRLPGSVPVVTAPAAGTEDASGAAPAPTAGEGDHVDEQLDDQVEEVEPSASGSTDVGSAGEGEGPGHASGGHGPADTADVGDGDDATAAIPGAEVAEVLHRDRDHGDGPDSRRRLDDSAELRFGDISLAEAHDLEALGEPDDEDRPIDPLLRPANQD